MRLQMDLRNISPGRTANAPKVIVAGISLQLKCGYPNPFHLAYCPLTKDRLGLYSGAVLEY